MEKEDIKSLLTGYLKEMEGLGEEFLFFDRGKKAQKSGLLSELRQLELVCMGCRRCPLYKTRRNVVFGKGNENAILMLVGEAPGEREDITGEPFVGAAGELLTNELKAINLTRDDVYIANVLKCRPPNNRDPKPEEVSACKGYLVRQIELIKPKLVLALGRHALRLLTGYEGSLSQIRGNVLYYKGIKVIPTYHPAALIYHQEWKKGAWEDLKLARKMYDEILKTSNHR
jgi:DNA polymerase